MKLTFFRTLGLFAVLALASPAFASVPISHDPVVVAVTGANPDCGQALAQPSAMVFVETAQSCDPAILAAADICLTKVSSAIAAAMPPDPSGFGCSSSPFRSPPD